MDDLKGKCFKCTSCGSDFNQSSAMDACKICKQSQCHDCMNDEGVCVPCSQLKH